MNIEVDIHTLLEQSYETARTYLGYAIRDIDDSLGEGYAKEHPELIGAYMKTAAADFQTAIIAKAILELRDSIKEHGTTVFHSAEEIVDKLR